MTEDNPSVPPPSAGKGRTALHNIVNWTFGRALVPPIVATVIGGVIVLLVQPFLPPLAVANIPCQNNSVFIKDIDKVIDGTQVPSGTTFVKQWEVRNPETSNSCNWTKEYNVVRHDTGAVEACVSGCVDATLTIDGKPSFFLSELPDFHAEKGPGSTLIVSIPMVAPTTPGTYKSSWILRSPQGIEFGDPFWVVIEVK